MDAFALDLVVAVQPLRINDGDGALVILDDDFLGAGFHPAGQLRQVRPPGTEGSRPWQRSPRVVPWGYVVVQNYVHAMNGRRAIPSNWRTRVGAGMFCASVTRGVLSTLCRFDPIVVISDVPCRWAYRPRRANPCASAALGVLSVRSKDMLTGCVRLPGCTSGWSPMVPAIGGVGASMRSSFPVRTRRGGPSTAGSARYSMFCAEVSLAL